MSKAQEKQEKRNVEIVTALLNRKLVDFKEEYFNKYIAWAMSDLENKRAHLVKVDGQVIDPMHPLRGSYNTKAQVEAIDVKLSRPSLISFTAMKEADSSYKTKIDRVAKKIVDAGMSYLGLRLEMLSDVGGAFEFLVSDDNMEVHARVIFANGMIKAPHFRFITTVRNK